MPDKPWTIGRLLSWTTEFLRDKGSDSSRLDAEVLLAHVRNCPRIELYTAYEEVATDALRQAFRELVSQRAAGKPVAYLVGQREFFSLSFRVTPDVLIPRPETELLVVRLLDLAKALPAGDALRIADVGAGSGNIAVCCAKHLPQCHVTAIDLSEAALAVARDNATRHEVAGRIDFLQSDLFDSYSDTERFHFIVSNPPYVTTAEMEQLPASVAQHEPHVALDGGERGTTVIERLLPQAAERLTAGGWLLMEIGPAIASRVEQLVAAMPDFDLQETEKDLTGHPRVVQAQKK